MNTRANWQTPYGFHPAPSGQVAGLPLVGGFSPLQLAGLVGFWRADQGVTAPGGTVSSWADQSGNGNTLTVAAGTLAPSFNAIGFNAAFPGITFSSTAGVFVTCLTNSAFNFASASISVFVLVDLTAVQIADSGVVSFVRSGSAGADDFSAGNFTLDLAHSGVANTFTAYSNGGIGDSGSSLAVPYSPTRTMLGFTVNSSGSGNAWVNGAIVGSATAGTASIGVNPNAISFGARPALSINNLGLNAVAAFWGITTAEMSAGDWTNLKNWSNANWGTSF